MSNNNSKINTVLLFVILIILVAGVFFFTKGSSMTTSNGTNGNGNQTGANLEILGNKADLVSFSIKPGDKVSGKVTATGSVKGGYFFEANIGVNILGANKAL